MKRSIGGGGCDAVETVETDDYWWWVLLPTVGVVVASRSSTELLWQRQLGRLGRLLRQLLLLLLPLPLLQAVIIQFLMALARGGLCVVVDEIGHRLSHHRFHYCRCYYLHLRYRHLRLEQDFGSPPHHQAAAPPNTVAVNITFVLETMSAS